MGLTWLTDIYKDGYNAMIFDELTEDIFLDTSANKFGEIKSYLLQDTIQKDFNTRLI